MPSQFGGLPIDDIESTTGGSRFGGIPLDQTTERPDSAMMGAIKDIGNNTLESLKNTATQTGEAVSEPMNNPSVLDWSQHPVMGPMDAAVRSLGKAGNAVGGAYGAITSPLQGALSASVENSGIIPWAAKEIKENLVPNDPRFTANISPDQQHQLAMQSGSDLTNAAMMGKAGAIGEENAAKAAGLPPASKPYDPMADVWDQLQKQHNNNAPRQGFFASESSDPNIAPIYKGNPKQVLDLARETYDNAEKLGGEIPAQTIQTTVQDLGKNKQIGQQTARGQAFAGDNIVSKTMTDLQEATKDNSPWTIKDANEIDDALRGRIQQARASGDYDGARRLGIIKTALRDTYKTAAANDPQGASGFNEWIKGDKLYSAGMAAQEAQDIIDNGERADVPSTAIKNGFKTFVKNDDNRAGLSAAEWAAAEHAADTGIVTAALKTMGSKLISGVAGGLGGAAGGGFPGAMLGAAAGEAVGFPMRSAATALQKGRGNDFIQQIMQRPVVQEALANKNTPSIPSAKIIPNSAAASLKPMVLPSLQNQPSTPFLNGKYTAKFSPTGSAVFDNGKLIASYNYGDQIVVDPEYQGQGIGKELAFQWHKRNPNEPLPAEMTSESKSLFDKVSERIKNNKGSATVPVAMGGGAAAVASQLLNKPSNNIGDQNLQELHKLQFPEQPQSSLPDVKNFAKAESNNNPNAKNPNSSASGLYQFTNKTWGDMVKKYGKQTGIDLGDKNDPKAQATMASLLAKDNIQSLQNTLGRMPTKGELYTAHVLGAQGASKLIQANPNQEAIMLFPRQVFDANRNLFFSGKTPRTVADVRNILEKKVA